MITLYDAHWIYLHFTEAKEKTDKTYSCLKYLKANSIMENFPSSVSVSVELILLSSSCKGEWICLAKTRSSGLDCNIDVCEIENKFEGFLRMYHNQQLCYVSQYWACKMPRWWKILRLTKYQISNFPSFYYFMYL